MITNYLRLAFFLFLPALTPALAQKKPNIIVILADDLGYADLGCYGSEIPTPNLDALAKGGVRFTNFYNTARCCPTRATLLTGVYAHQAGIGHMMDDKGADHPSYRGQLNHHVVTIAEVMNGAGYFTAMTGKWHVGHQHGVYPWNRGFKRSLNAPAGGFYYAEGQNAKLFLNGEEVTTNYDKVPKDWYTTDLWTDFGLRFIDEAVTEKKPFMLYLAHNAPHFPLQAPEEDIARFRGKYLKGYEQLRQERYQKQLKLGLIDPSWKLPPRNPNIPRWESLSDAEKKQYDDMMAIYAAVIYRLDKSIGDLVAGLKKRGVFDDTVILFVSDNGGNAEPGIEGKYDGDKPGDAKSNVFLGQGWAEAACTPFWAYKHHTHEGGISSPGIVLWPNGIPAARNGKFEKEPAHIVDIMATLVDLGGAKYPETFDGNNIQPLEGASLKPAFTGKPITRKAPIFWEHENNRAILDGKWKLVAEKTEKWQLYDIEKDRTELNDQFDKQPAIAKKMVEQYESWYKRVGAEDYDKTFKWFYDYEKAKAGK
ncbi:arylsulfatase [Dyadobacter sandarakinus]|uniref:Arylsulfatase n=1 Tax=Dyadobacter sandarakinus TaxID=2747268 RepID=A0ABX7I4E9_9BACT|nr:arylsulfatase [Dyadobacter sandarakinus]QRR00976.1 arylsulfatase [Dyadobacter sandarakinus]